MTLIDNAGKVIKYAYSFWGMILSGLAVILPDYIPYLVDYLPRKAVFTLIAIAVVARFIKQPSISGEKAEADDDAALGI